MKNFDLVFLDKKFLLLGVLEINGRTAAAKRKQLIAWLNPKNTTNVKIWKDAEYILIIPKQLVPPKIVTLLQGCLSVIRDALRRGHKLLPINVRLMYLRGMYRKEIATELGKDEREVKTIIAEFKPEYHRNTCRRIIRNIDADNKYGVQLALFKDEDFPFGAGIIAGD